MSPRTLLLIFGILLPWAALPHRAGAADPPSLTATIEGAVIYESDRKRPWRFRRNYVASRKQGHLAEAVVCLAIRERQTDDDASPRQWTVNQKEYRFVPQTLAVQAGDQIRFTNGDPLLHDVTMRQEREGGQPISQDAFSLREREEIFRSFQEAGGGERPIALTCRFHGSMQGWIYVFGHRHFQVTAKDGRFRLEGVPVGKQKLVVVHAAGRLRWEQELNLVAGKTRQIEIRVSPDHLVTNEE